MPTLAEFGKSYAERIADALRQDGFTRYATINESVVRSSRTARVLRDILREIDGLVIAETREKLSASDRAAIWRTVATELTLPDAVLMEKAAMAASNDDLTDLVDTIDNILKGRSK